MAEFGDDTEIIFNLGGKEVRTTMSELEGVGLSAAKGAGHAIDARQLELPLARRATIAFDHAFDELKEACYSHAMTDENSPVALKINDMAFIDERSKRPMHCSVGVTYKPDALFIHPEDFHRYVATFASRVATVERVAYLIKCHLRAALQPFEVKVVVGNSASASVHVKASSSYKFEDL